MAKYVRNMIKSEGLWHYVLIFPLPAVSPALLPSVCLPVTLLHTLVNEAMTHTHRYGHTHRGGTARRMVWAADISLRAICQSELDRAHVNTLKPHNHSRPQTCESCRRMRDFFFLFSSLYLNRAHVCAEFILHNASFPALTFCHLVIHAVNHRAATV